MTSERFLVLPFQFNGNYANRLQKSIERNNQQEISVLFSNISLSTSTKGQEQEIMAAADLLQDPYLGTLDMTTSGHIKI